MNEQTISSLVDSNPVASFYQIITENSFDGVVILDAELMFTYISPNSYKLFGYDPSEMRLFVPTELTHPDDLPRVLSEIQKAIENPQFKPTLEYRFRNKAGEWTWIEVRYSNLFTHPQINGLLVNFKLINDRRNREQKLKQSEALLAATLSHTRYSIWSIDADYCLLYANERFVNDYYLSFGVRLEIGKSLVDYLPALIKDTWQKLYDKALANNAFIDEVNVKIGNLDIYVEVSATPIVVDGIVQGVSFYGDNITERKMAEIKLVQNTENLSKILKASNQFIKPKAIDVDFDEVTDVLCQISGAKYVIFNQFFADYSKTISISGLEKTNETLFEYLNIDFKSVKWKRQDTFESNWVNDKLTILEDISPILSAHFKPAVIQLLISKFNIGNVAVVRIDGNNRIVGNLFFIYEKGKTADNLELIEMFTYQLGQYIERRNADDALIQKMDEMERFHKLTVNRELTMIELKKEINELLRKMGQEEKYRIVGG